MSAIAQEPLVLNEDESQVVSELLESERAQLLVEIRHTHHREFRDELRQRLVVVEKLAQRLQGA